MDEMDVVADGCDSGRGGGGRETGQSVYCSA